MKKHTYVELEDQDWFPGWMRSYQMDFLGYLSKFLGIYRPTSKILDSFSPKKVLDLASGNGMAAELAYGYTKWTDFEFYLSDKYNSIQREILELDILNSPLPGASLYTMFNSLHHFKPEELKILVNQILKSGNRFAFFEPLQPNILTALKVLLSTLILPFFLVPFMRPFRWDRILMTYIIPIGPIICLYDGLVSVWKSYSTQELDKIVMSLKNPELKTGLTKSFLANITYISG